MATTTFTAALLIFANLWLIALISFAVVASAISLYILGSIDAIVGPSLAISLICSAVSFVYLTLQSVNVRHTTHRRWHRSWLSSTCVHLPRVLILLYIIATTIALVVLFKQPICQNHGVGQDAAAWQAGVGCWIFRTLVSLDTVMLVLSFTLFCLLEVNGRYVSLALFHFEYAPTSTLGHRRRRNLIASPYGASVETFPRPITRDSEDEIQLMHEKRNSQQRSLSPSPTYHTFDSIKTNTMVWPGSGSTSRKLTREGSRDDFLCEPPILIDLTLHGSLPAHRSTGFAPPLPEKDRANANTTTIFSSAQLKSRTISDVPDIPPNVRHSFLDLKNIIAPLVTAPIAAKAISEQKLCTHSAPHNFGVNMVNPKTRFKSTSALPFETATRAHSMVDLASYVTAAANDDHNADSRTDITTSTSAVPIAPANKSHTPRPSTDTIGCLSISSLPEHPLPAWCPQSLKSAPLSADPAIRRLTELQSRSRSSMVRKSRMGVSKKRISFDAFEFGFSPRGRKSAMGTRGAPMMSSPLREDAVDVMSVDLSEFPATPTPLARGRAGDSQKKAKEEEANISTIATNKENCPAIGSSLITNAMNTSTKPPVPKSTPFKKDKTVKRGHARAVSSMSKSTSSKGSYSIMPPAAGRRRGGSSASGSALGLGIEGVNVVSIATTAKENGERLDERATRRAREKKVVERGRFEKLPR